MNLKARVSHLEAHAPPRRGEPAPPSFDEFIRMYAAGEITVDDIDPSQEGWIGHMATFLALVNEKG